MEIQDPASKEDLLCRLHRLEGQIRGVEAMITSDRGCAEVLQQLSAARSALESVTGNYLKNMVAECLSQGENGENLNSRTELAEQIARLVIRNC